MMRGIVALFFLIMIVGAEMLPLQKPKVYHDNNISGWVMSEKLDGIRAYWDGKTLQTKNGNPIHAPAWFTKNFPSFHLDGELWTKRGDFENIQSIVLDSNPSDDWKQITYNIFEVPHAEGNFTTRLKQISHYHDRYINVIEQIVCKDKNQLNSFLKEIEAKGGEGVIIKDPSLDYFSGRSAHVLKVKSFKDMEGVVIGTNPGKGKYRDMIGSLKIKLENGIIFNLGGGLSDDERKQIFPLGSVVTFKYYGFTKYGKPKFASFLRLRSPE